MRFPLVTATRVSSRCRASINMRVVIIITPGAPQRAKQKGRRRPWRAAAVDRVQTEKDVIAARGPRPVLDAHAVFRHVDARRKCDCVGMGRGHGKPHTASTCYGVTVMAGDAGMGSAAARSSGWTDGHVFPRMSGAGEAMNRESRGSAFPLKRPDGIGSDTVSVSGASIGTDQRQPKARQTHGNVRARRQGVLRNSC